jgi:hypothetical protein
MADQPATKKELAALQKQVDDLRKSFEAQKKEMLTTHSQTIVGLEWKVDELYESLKKLQK